MHQNTPPIGRLYDVAGRRLFLHRSGGGAPGVVFLPGASAVGLDYLNVHDRVAEFTTSVLYDRGGTGWSDRIPLPRTAAENAVELRDLLRAAGVPAPYVLVAHSLGAAHARRFAQLFPDEVAGLLLVESFYEDWDRHMPEHLHLERTRQPQPGRLQLWFISRLARGFYRRVLAGWPAELRDLLVERHVSPEWWQIGVRERSNLPQLRDELRDGGPVPDVPLIALTALGEDPGLKLFMSKKSRRDMNDGKRRLYDALADSVPRGEHRTLDDARHSTVHTDRPDAVVAGIRDLLDRAGK